MNPPREPETVELLASEYQRRLTVAGHHEWRESISTARPFDEVDEAVAVDDFAPSQTKSGKEIGRLLSILDNLPTGKDSK
jgi:hypothetical protein